MKTISTLLAFILLATITFSQNVTEKDNNGNRAGLFQFQQRNMNSPSDAGNDWVSVGPFGGDVVDLAASVALPGNIYATAGTPFISTDGGTSWTAMDELTALASGTVNAIEATANGTLIATGTYTNGKVFRSTDGGITWQNRTIPVTVPGTCIAMDPADTNTMYVGLMSNISSSTNKVIVKSVNGGLNWTAIDMTTVLPVGYSVASISVDPVNSQTLFAIGRESFSNALLVASFDGGNTWEDRTGSLPSGIPFNCVALGGGSVYVAGGQLFGSQFMGIYESTDYGLTWNNISSSFPNKVSNYILVDPADPDHLLVGTEGDGIYSSTDGGTTWNYTTNGAGDNGAARTIFIDPVSPSTIYAGYLSIAITRTTDGGANWDYASNGIATLAVNDVDIDRTDPARVLAGFEAQNSGGCYLSLDHGTTWSLVTGLPGTRFSKVGVFADGALCAWSNGPTTVAQEGLYKSTDNGATWTNMGPAIGNLFETEVFSLATSATDPGLVFVGGNNFGVNGWKPVIWRSTNGGQDWENVLIGTEDFDSFRYLWIDPLSGDQTIYAAMGSQVAGALYKSTDGGDTWTVISGTIPGTQLWYGAIISDSANPDKIIASAGGFGTPGTAWISNDAGTTWNSTYLSLDSYSKIPDLVINPSVSDVVYAASLLDGVSISTNGGMTWATANTGLPATNVTGFSYPWPTTSGWDMFASTFTNSIYRTTLWDPAQGTGDLKGNSGISVYPNPSDGDFTLFAGSGKIKSVEILNSIGIPVATMNAMSAESKIPISIRVPDGIYLARITRTDGTFGSVVIAIAH